MLEEKVERKGKKTTHGTDATINQKRKLTADGRGQENVHETKYARNISKKSLEKELRRATTAEVRFDEGSRALYATDSSNYRQVPIGVVIPRTEEDIINTFSICRKHHAPILTRGGGTSLAGQCCNVAVILDFSKYFNRILHYSLEDKTVTVQTGIVLDDMRHATEKKLGLTFGPDPATHNHCTIGGMLGNNSCGVHSVMAQFEGTGARTSDNVASMRILTYDGIQMDVGPTSDEELERIIADGGRKGEIYERLKSFRDKYAALIREKFPNIPRRVSGYNLPDLLPENGFNVARALVGSENTLVTILDATMKLVHAPAYRTLLVLGYEDVFAAGRHVPEILEHRPIGLEGIDDLLIEYMRKKNLNIKDLSLLPPGKGWLLVEFGGESKEDADSKARALMDSLRRNKSRPSMSLFDDPEQEKKLWEVRESGLGATAWVPGEPMSVPGWEDSAVDPKYVGDYLKDLKALFAKYDYHPSVYGHFGQGCIHCRIQFDLFTEEGLEKYREFTVEAAHLVVKYGGSLSGEHGDGQSRADLLEIMYGKELVEAFRKFKEIWDPEWKMNPGKIVDSYGQLSNLRINNHYDPPESKTHFTFTEDANSFAHATLRCVGVGACRKEEGGIMCPSYMVTREEEHSTRGRARLLFEMLQGDVLKNGWKDKNVKEALDLCLACKGCKGECPVQVDMATYKSEFLSHYYEGRLRPVQAYAFGWIHGWSRLASIYPEVANFFTHSPIVSSVVKAVAGISKKRELPRFAEKTFRSWFKSRERERERKRERVRVKGLEGVKQMAGTKGVANRVVIWTDTFNNYFQPETLVAGVHVLEAAGFEVVIPGKNLCCGRPLFDFGMIRTAKKKLREIITELADEIADGTPVVGLEPSCVAVFRDELTALFPNNPDARRLKKLVYTLGEFLNEYSPSVNFPLLRQDAIMQSHCHHQAVMKSDYEIDILKKTGLNIHKLDSGCCGMAGYFGYEKGKHYEVSIAAGERVLLPAVRQAPTDTIIVADGFSCREQIGQETGRKAMHFAQVLQMAMEENGSGRIVNLPEKKYVEEKKIVDEKGSARRNRVALGMLSFLASALIAYKIKRHIA